MENVSPMLQQYLSMKQEVGQDTLLFFRLGDFYELFYEDAKIVSSELELILTARAAGNNQKAPMCGVPHHAAHSYIQRLISKGYKVAIAQQMEDPATAKGLVKREVTKIITQGTNFDHDESESTFLASITSDLFNFYVSLYDITNNTLKNIQIEKDYGQLMTVLVQHHVKEILIEPSVEKKWLQDNTEYHLSEHKLSKLPKSSKDEALERLESYIEYTQKQSIQPHALKTSKPSMKLDYVSLMNLEMLEVLRVNSKSHSLFSYLNKTKTSMGTRQLKEWIKYPLLELNDILVRQNKVEFLVQEYLLAHQLSENLKEVYDIGRIATKLEYKTAHAQDAVRLKQTLLMYQQILDLFEGTPFLDDLSVDPLNSLAYKIEKTVVEEPPLTVGNQPTIKEGIHFELDEYRSLLTDSNTWLLNYESKLREETGIKNLKVGYSKQFGYYLEVSKGQLSQVKEEYGFIRRQTLTNAERYLTAELKEQEDKITSASDKVSLIENQVLSELLEELLLSVNPIRDIAFSLSEIDCYYALSQISSTPGFVKPSFNTTREIELINSSHPILEYSTKSHKIIANDFIMNPDQDVMILTGPNMGGKSTFMRQVAITIIMAQMGCFVKADSAKLPLFDAIYTRMGASDDIMSGHSTFMIEMIEANQAITKATPNSLILFDEIGRGTSTYDGMAIAGAILDYVASKIKARCIFSTHYHQLTQLAEKHTNIVNYQVMVEEKNEEITFLYQVKPGCANRSYGIHVAALADLPKELLVEANHRLNEMQKQSFEFSEAEEKPLVVLSPAQKKLRSLDINQLTPLEALQVLNDLVDLERQDNHE